jgi:ATP-dependent RNA helicase DHX37/DHR1
VFEHQLDAFAAPEITRVPIEGVVLQMKAMHIDAVAGFPFPTPPDRLALRKAEKTLVRLGGLDAASGRITDLGRSMALFPLSPRYARMLVSGRQKDCLPYVIAMVSALSVGDPFMGEEALEGDEDDNDVENASKELRHLTSEAERAKEARRMRRKAFFQSQHVSST